MNSIAYSAAVTELNCEERNLEIFRTLSVEYEAKRYSLLFIYLFIYCSMPSPAFIIQFRYVHVV